MNKITVLTVDDTQAKLILKPNMAIIKVPSNIPTEQQIEVRNKLIKITDLQKDNKEFLKIYYKIGTPYLFLNRKVSAKKKETITTYKYDEL